MGSGANSSYATHSKNLERILFGYTYEEDCGARI